MTSQDPKRNQSIPDIEWPETEPFLALPAWLWTQLPHLEPIAKGTNNQSYLVTSGAQSWILKRYRNAGLLARIRFEHELLRALASANLPFAVPSPVRAISGENTVEIANGANAIRYALFQRIPGRAARFGSLEDAFRCGKALAELDLALAAIRLDPAIPLPGAFGELGAVHAEVPDPLAAIQRQFRDRAVATDLARIVSRAEERWRHRTAGWGIQLMHSDFYPSNTLMEGGEVTGILDFEFSGPGYRAMDFAIGLAAFSASDWNDGCAWPLMESFATGYLRRSPLDAEELAATPALLLMREATSLIHWLGRLEQGLTALDDLHARARRLLTLDQWLEAHQGELVNRLERIACP